MKIKRILAGGLAALMAGTTLAFGAFAATTLQDFATVSDSTLTSPVIVVGDMKAGALSTAATAAAKAEDTIAAADVAAAVAGYATKTGTCAATGEGIAVSDGADISTTNTKLYLADGLNTAKTTLTKSDLSTLLASGSVSVSGTAYTYDQYISLGAKTVTFGKSGQQIAPQLYVDLGTASGTPAYTSMVVFNKPLNISDASNVQGKTIDIFGGTYLIATGSGGTSEGYNPLILYDAGLTKTLTQDEAVTVEIGGTEYTVVATYVGSTTAVIKVNEESTDPLAAAGSDVVGGLNVYIKSVLYKGVQGQLDKVIVSLGSGKLTLTNGQKAKFGQNAETSVDNTLVTLTGSGTGLSKLQIAVAAQKTDADYVAVNSAYTDPVFKAFKLGFGGISPALDSSARDTITVEPSGSLGAQLTMTDYRGHEATIIFAYDNDTSASTITPNLGDSSLYDYHVIEGEAMHENEYVILAQGDFSHLFQLTDVNNIGESTANIVLKDVFSGDQITINMEAPGYDNATFYVDGQTYYAYNNSASDDFKFTWGTNAAANKVGNETTLFPYLKGNNGELIAIIGNTTAAVTIGNATKGVCNMYIDLPGGDGDTGRTTLCMSNQTATHANSTTITAGQITYGFSADTSNAVLQNISSTADAKDIDGYPLVLVVEEKGKDTASALKRNAVIAQARSYSSGGTASMAICTAANCVRWTDSQAVTGNNDPSDTYTYYEIDRYGTYAKYNTYTQGKVELFYPDSQAAMSVAFGSDPTFSTTTGTAASTYSEAVPITNAVAKFASEIAATPTSDMILIGGPCVNTLVAQLLNMSTASGDCYNEFVAAYPTKGVVKVVENAFSSGKKALIIAGTNAANTRDLADNYVIKGDLSEAA